MKLYFPALAMTVLLTACGSDSDSSSPDITPTPVTMQTNVCYLMKTTMGDIKIGLDNVNTPISAANFKSYVDTKFYDGTLFHRVVHNFVNQGGGFTTGLKVKPNSKSAIKNEASVGFSNARGTIAMARTSAPDSATSQFYFNVLNNSNLDYSSSSAGYAVFGKILEGIEVMDLMNVVTTNQDVPVTEIVINTVTEVNCS